MIFLDKKASQINDIGVQSLACQDAQYLQRLLIIDPEKLTDTELLCLILTQTSCWNESNHIAELLIQKFGTFSAAISASADQLVTVDGVGDAVSLAFKVVRAAILRMLREKICDRPVLSSSLELQEYLKAKLQHETIEVFTVIYLDQKNQMIKDEPLWRGTVNQVIVYPREVVRRALEFGASALILVHNHPTGNSQPSWQDIDITKSIIQAAAVFNIVVHDHIIVGYKECSSLRYSRPNLFASPH